MKKYQNYLNVGCGNKYNNEWTNIDMHSNSKYVISHNLLKGLPFSDNKFDVVYHSQVLEHFPKEKAPGFIKECYRVLSPNGIIRIATPNLENIVDEYNKYLNQNLENPTENSKANYEWIMLELLDQTVRNQSGGQMAKYLGQTNISNKNYIIDRIGHVGESHINNNNSRNLKTAFLQKLRTLGLRNIIAKALDHITTKIKNILFGKKYTIGNFRLGGEIHMWLYDRYSLSELLKEAGFKNIKIKSPFDSDIPDWSSHELDVKNGKAFDPTSLFIEATK